LTYFHSLFYKFVVPMYETLLSVEELKGLMHEASSNLVVVDCRFSLADAEWGRSEYALGNIPGAIYAHLNEDLSGPILPGVTGRHPLPNPEQFHQWVEMHGITNDSQIIAYDQGGGGVASGLWWLMRWLGHDTVAVLDGGWAAWKKAGMPAEEKVHVPARGNFTVTLRNELIIEAGLVGQWACDGKHVVIDSREARRYDGIEEPIDPVAGHIPGAMNKPFGENINADGTWKPVEALRQRFTPLLETNSCEEIAFYCGSGVTACHNLLAFKHAGFGDARLYPGSWSEWITDEKRGVEVSENYE
jgi:thiosulfate/3-mercaptopyruvate sulfurtransferase